MIFKRKLLESIVIDKELIQEYNTIPSKEQQIRFIRDKLLSHSKDSLFSYYDQKLDAVLEQAIIEKGLTRNNDFLYYLIDWNESVPASKVKDAGKKFKYLYDSYKSNNIDLLAKGGPKGDLFRDLSLFNRDYDDFTYAVNTLNMIAEGKYKDFLKKPSVVNIKHLYSGNDLKPSGIKDKKSEDTETPETAPTIYATIEAWSRAGEEYSDEELADNMKNKEQEDDPKKSKKKIQQLDSETKKFIKKLDKMDKEDLQTIFDVIKKMMKE